MLVTLAVRKGGRECVMRSVGIKKAEGHRDAQGGNCRLADSLQAREGRTNWSCEILEVWGQLAEGDPGR